MIIVHQKPSQPKETIMACNCLEPNPNHRFELNEKTRAAVVSAMADLRTLRGAMTIIRNGGWEQTFRNLLAVRLEEAAGVTAFCESGNRVDIVVRCNTCRLNPAELGGRVAVEVKTNFVTQPEEIPVRVRGRNGIERFKPGALHQLAAAHNVGTSSSYFLVYLLIELCADEPTSLTIAHNAAPTPPYKHFQIGAGIGKQLRDHAFTKIADLFPNQQVQPIAISVAANGAVATVHAFLARVGFSDGAAPWVPEGFAVAADFGNFGGTLELL